MKLYEINAQIEQLVNAIDVDENGEALGNLDEIVARLDSLEMEKNSVLRYLAKLVLNLRSDVKALKDEETRLKERRARLENKVSRLMEILDRECDGEKTDLGVATVNYRKTQSLTVSDSYAAVDWLINHHYFDCYDMPEPQIHKTEVKKLFKNGENVPGCALVENISCSLK